MEKEIETLNERIAELTDFIDDRIRELQTNVNDLQEKLDNQEEDVNTWPKEGDEYCYVDCNMMEVDYSFWHDDIIDNNRNDLGNCFRTKEEAEKAVEKLKALKRLRDEGFKFDTVIKHYSTIFDETDLKIEATAPKSYDKADDDLKLLFEEEE